VEKVELPPLACDAFTRYLLRQSPNREPAAARDGLDAVGIKPQAADQE